MADERRGEPARPARPPPGSGSDEPSPTPARREPRPTVADAYWVTAPGRGEIRRAGLPRPGPGEVLVRALHSAVSRGTEALVALGRVPPSQHAAMRAPFQEGEFPFPVKYGYSSVGVVEEGPAGLLGRAVFCLHPHQTAYVVPAGAVRPLPEGVPPGRAVLAANAETALNAAWDAGALPGERIHVIGAGVVGCLAGWLLARLPGAEVTLADTDPARAAVAAALGVAFAPPEALAPDADLVVHASGDPAGPAPRAGGRRPRGPHPGAELVRRPRGGAAARRGVPRPAPARRWARRSAPSPRRPGRAGATPAASPRRSSCCASPRSTR